MQATPKEVILYETSNGRCPFAEWLTSLRDKKAVDKITLRIRRVEQGNFGDYKSVSSICELRIDYGAGYRVYFGQMGNTIVVLLCGGDKNTQYKDIVTQEYWEDYKS